MILFIIKKAVTCYFKTYVFKLFPTFTYIFYTSQLILNIFKIIYRLEESGMFYFHNSTKI